MTRNGEEPFLASVLLLLESQWCAGLPLRLNARPDCGFLPLDRNLVPHARVPSTWHRLIASRTKRDGSAARVHRLLIDRPA